MLAADLISYKKNRDVHAAQKQISDLKKLLSTRVENELTQTY